MSGHTWPWYGATPPHTLRPGPAPHLQVLRHERRRAPGRGATAMLLLGLWGRALHLVMLLVVLLVLLLVLLVAAARLRQQLFAPPARLGQAVVTQLGGGWGGRGRGGRRASGWFSWRSTVLTVN